MPQMNRVKRAPEESQSHRRETPISGSLAPKAPSPRRADLLWTNVQKSGEVKRRAALTLSARFTVGGMGFRRFDDWPHGPFENEFRR